MTDEENWRNIGRIARAAQEAGITFEQAMRFIAAWGLLMDADKAGAHKQPELTQ